MTTETTTAATTTASFVPGNSGICWAEYTPKCIARRTIPKIRRGWHPVGVITAGNLGPVGHVLVIGPTGYWYTVQA